MIAALLYFLMLMARAADIGDWIAYYQYLAQLESC